MNLNSLLRKVILKFRKNLLILKLLIKLLILSLIVKLKESVADREKIRKSQKIKKGILKMKKKTLKEEGNLFEDIKEPLQEEEELGEENQNSLNLPSLTIEKELARDILKLPFDIWHTIVPEVKTLDDSVAENLSFPFLRIIYKYGWQSFFKDELLLIIGLGSQVIPRVYITTQKAKIKKNVKNDNRETGDGENNVSEKINNNGKL